MVQRPRAPPPISLHRTTARRCACLYSGVHARLVTVICCCSKHSRLTQQLHGRGLLWMGGARQRDRLKNQRATYAGSVRDSRRKSIFSWRRPPSTPHHLSSLTSSDSANAAPFASLGYAASNYAMTKIYLRTLARPPLANMINRSLDFVLGLIFSFSRLEAKK